MATPPLGHILPQDRTQAQADAHAAAVALCPRFSPPPTPKLVKGDKVILTKFWSDPEVVADVGFEFTGYGQYSGSCVGVSEGDAIATLAAIQRKLADNPTKAFAPWWPFPYGRTRLAEGDRGQGEGAVDSVMGQTLIKEGVFDINQAGLPKFTKNGPDGLWLTEQIEMEWSDGASIDPRFMALGKLYPLGSQIPLNNVDDVETSIVNGCPVLDGYGMYCGSGSIQGSGDLACVMGKYDGNGGHSTCFLGVWIHPTFGRLFLYSNQWDSSTYPKDPAGGGRCCVWLPEAEVVYAFKNGMSDGEIMALSHLTYIPAQADKILTWFM